MKHKRVSVSASKFADLCWHLQQDEYNRDQLCKLIGVADSTLRAWLRYLRKPGKKQVYICERRVRGTVGAAKLYYTWGNEPDALPLKAKGDSVYSERYRQKKLRNILNGIASVSSPTSTSE